jgi:hypothetical protein
VQAPANGRPRRCVRSAAACPMRPSLGFLTRSRRC